MIPHKRDIQIGSVSYLNARPLIFGLQEQEDLALHLDVPARLLDGMRSGRFDVALLPVIDYQRLEGLCIVPAGGIGCDGPTLTVRIFSPCPIDQIRTLACDIESHTSVALARVILAERYQMQPEFVQWPAGAGAGSTLSQETAQLLIGDKVVCDPPPEREHQLDLGEAWKELTGRPFVFAAWMTRAGTDLGDLPERLSRAREQGLQHVEEILARFAVPRGWPAETARRYLTQYLHYRIGEAQLDAMRLFHQFAARHGVIADPPRPIALYRA